MKQTSAHDVTEGMIAVYPVARSEFDVKTDKHIGHAEDRRTAARMIRQHLSALDGSSEPLKAADILYSTTLNAYFIDD